MLAGLPLACSDAGDGGEPGTPATRQPSCRLADALHEHQLQVDATLRATLDTSLVGRLETRTSVPHAWDSGGAGHDAIAYRIDEATALRIAVAPGAVERVRLVDATGATVAEAGADGAIVTADVSPGEYTLILASDDRREIHYVVQPESCRSGRARTSATVGAAAATNDQTPGVYVQELPAASSVIGAQTSVTAFVGAIGSGPIGTPVQLLDASDFAATFGTAAEQSLVGRAVAQFFANGGYTAWVVGTSAATPAELLGDATGGGVNALAEADAWSILVLPDVATLSPDEATDVLASAVPFAASRNAFTIVDPPLVLADVAAVTGWVSGSLIPALPLGVLQYAAAYWPPLQVEDAAGATVTMGAAGAVAGLYASGDAEDGVWHQPTGAIAGAPDATIALPLVLDDASVAALSAAQVNALRSTSQGDSVSGARTLAAPDLLGGNVGSSRTDLMIRTSIVESLRWVVFEPDDPTLWSTVGAAVSGFLTTLWAQGALFGTTAADAFVVTCDATTNPPQQILLGLLRLEVQLALDGPGRTRLESYTFATAGPAS